MKIRCKELVDIGAGAPVWLARVQTERGKQ
jgi:hypothetical protein